MWANESASAMMESSRGSGFMDTSLNVSDDGKSGSAGSKRGQSCFPVMIAQMVRHGEELKVWGVPVRLVTFVAILRKCDDVSTKVTFYFEDETGIIKGVKWLDGQSAEFQCPVSLNSYARVHGSIRKQNNETYVLVLNIQPIEHANELLTHLMEVTLVCLEGEKKVEQVSKGDNTFVSHSANVPASNLSSCLSNEQKIVYEIVKNSYSDYGSSRDEIKAKLPTYLLPQFDKIICFLADEGHVYTTKSDNHFKAV